LQSFLLLPIWRPLSNMEIIALQRHLDLISMHKC
jgi:hypothetical protein